MKMKKMFFLIPCELQSLGDISCRDVCHLNIMEQDRTQLVELKAPR